MFDITFLARLVYVFLLHMMLTFGKIDQIDYVTSQHWGRPCITDAWKEIYRDWYELMPVWVRTDSSLACACKTAVLKNSFSNPFADFPIERWKMKIQKQKCQRWNSFSDCAFDWKSEIPIERTLNLSSREVVSDWLASMLFMFAKPRQTHQAPQVPHLNLAAQR